MSIKKILIVTLGGMGDILNTTPIARHYKALSSPVRVDFLTKNKYGFLLSNNPDVDRVICTSSEFNSWNNEIATKYFKDQLSFDEYSEVIFAAPYMSPLYDKTERSTLLDMIKDETSGITDWACDFKPYAFPNEREIDEADSFISKTDGEFKILIEYEYFSQQSFMNVDSIIGLCKQFNDKKYDLIFSGKNKPDYLDTLKCKYDSNIYHYDLSFLSNAKLYNYINLFVGCSSGLTCLTASDFCDHSIERVELVRGLHWSTKLWSHLENRKIFYNNEDFLSFLSTL